MKELFEYIIVDGQTTVTKYRGGDSLTKVVIPEKFENCPVTKIGNAAFQDDRYFHYLVAENCGENPPETYSIIKEILIPDAVRIIANGAFQGLARLTGIKLPALLEVIGDDAFSLWCCCGSLYIPNGVKKIGEAAFGNPLFNDVYIPPSAIEISDDAFSEGIGTGPLNSSINLHLSPKAPPEQKRDFPWGYEYDFKILLDYDEYKG